MNHGMKVSGWGLAVCSLVALGGLAGCDAPSANEDVMTIRGAGSTFAAPIIKRWAEEYRSVHPEVVIKYEATGSGDGEKRFRDFNVDFAGTDAGLNRGELSAIDGGALQVPMTAGIIVLAYNREGLPADLKLPREVYVDAFLGKGTRWDDARIVEANPGKTLPSEPINIVTRLDSSGTTFAFTNHLAAISDEWADRFGSSNATSDADRGVKILDWPGKAMKASGNSGVAGRVKQTLYSLGYVQYGAARAVDLAMASIENQAGNYVSPSGASGLEALMNVELQENEVAYVPDPSGERSYPIITYTWMLVRKSYPGAAKTDVVKSFAKWCLSKGQEFAEEAGNVRLAPKVIKKSEATLDALQFAGDAAVASR